ncbi:alpha/beta hydrolase fold-domain-containing protein [Aspergillus heterothallicus]
MTRCNAEYLQVLEEMQVKIRKAPRLPLDDADGRRAMIAQRFSGVQPFDYDVGNVSVRQYWVQLSDGHRLQIFGFHPVLPSSSSSAPSSSTAAVLHFHGGGMTMGSALDSQSLLAWYASMAEISVFSVEYRLAPEHPYPTPVEDCYASLKWLYREAKALSINPSRIGVMGDSAGGGLAAAVALLARDRKEISHPLAKQILIQPMLDDRDGSTVCPSSGFGTWTWDDNSAAWGAFLGSDSGSQDVLLACAVPARASHLRGLPSTYIEVGTLDIFHGHVLEFTARLREAQVDVDCQIYPGVPHAFHSILGNARMASTARQNHLRALQSF